MDIESRRVALFVALIQMLAVFGVFIFLCALQRRSLYVPLLLFFVPVIWFYLVSFLQEKGQDKLAAVVFYASFPYIGFLLVWLSKLSIYFMEHLNI